MSDKYEKTSPTAMKALSFPHINLRNILGKTLLLSAALMLISPTTAFAAEHIVKLDAKHNTQKNPARLYLRAGTYQITPIGRYHGGDKGAWSVWSHTTCKHPRGCQRTVPTKFTGLHNNYYVSSDQLGNVMVNGKRIATVNKIPRLRMNSYYLIDGKQRAFEATQPMVYATEAAALKGALRSTFVMTKGGRVAFALLDNSRTTDNRGGMSLKITQIKPAR